MSNRSRGQAVGGAVGVAAGGGLGFGSTLTIVFIILKLTKVINWSWWWVFSPTLIPLAFSILLIGILLLAYLIINRRR